MRDLWVNLVTINSNEFLLAMIGAIDFDVLFYRINVDILVAILDFGQKYCFFLHFGTYIIFTLFNSLSHLQFKWPCRFRCNFLC